MIVDKLANWSTYAGIAPGLRPAFEFLREKATSGLQPGEYEIDGRDIYAVALHYDTAPVAEGRFETHESYADVQYVALGSELMGYTTKCLRRQPRREDDPAGDFTFFDLPERPTLVHLEAGCFAVFLPGEAHMPGKHLDSPKRVHKIVVKVRC